MKQQAGVSSDTGISGISGDPRSLRGRARKKVQILSISAPRTKSATTVPINRPSALLPSPLSSFSLFLRPPFFPSPPSPSLSHHRLLFPCAASHPKMITYTQVCSGYDTRGLPRIPLCHISRHLQASLSSPTACHSQNRKALIP